MKMKRAIAVLMILGIVSVSAFANIANPDRPKRSGKGIDTNLSIRLKRDATEARLIIPRSQLKQLRAELEATDAGADLASSTTKSSLGIQTIAGGAFLSLGLVFGGLWFARSRRPGSEQGKIVVTLAIAMAFGSGAAMVWANAGPPPEARSITGKMFSQAVHIYGFGSGRIKLEVTDDGDRVELIVPDPPAASTNPPE
jgi:hypothetical protein